MEACPCAPGDSVEGYDMKHCKRCDQTKPLSDFFTYKKSGTPRAVCKGCTAEKVRENRHANPERTRETSLRNTKSDYQRRKGAISQYKQGYYSENAEATKERCNANYYAKHDENKVRLLSYQKANRPKYNALNAKRRAAKLNAAVVVTDAELNNLVIEEAYSLAKLRSELNGIDHQVDHIVPLQNKNVCGLHSWTNLQVIPAIANVSKGNRFNESEARHV
jgi:hypothetical protein